MAAKERLGWVTSMWMRGHRGRCDYLKQAKRVITPTQEAVVEWGKSPKFGGKVDIGGWDEPRDDVDVVKVHGRNILIGGESRKGMREFVKQVLTSNFTVEEIKAIKNLYIETQPEKGRNFAGNHSTYCFPGGEHGAVVNIRPAYLKAEDVLTHEVVHAYRYVSNRNYPYDINSEEKETDLETIARLSEEGFFAKDCGYYQYIPGGRDKTIRNAAKLHDRVMMTGSTAKNLRGKEAIRRVNETFSESKIKTAHFSPAEALDMYFLVKLPNGTTITIHHRYPKKNPNLSKIKKNFVDEYGEGIEVWEWRDGVKVKIMDGMKKVKITSQSPPSKHYLIHHPDGTHHLVKATRPIKVGELKRQYAGCTVYELKRNQWVKLFGSGAKTLKRDKIIGGLDAGGKAVKELAGDADASRSYAYQVLKKSRKARVAGRKDLRYKK